MSLWGITFLTAGCGWKVSEPARVYKLAWHEVELGKLDPALEKTNSILSKYSDKGSQWHWRFQFLKAEILMRKGFYDESLALLQFDLPDKFASSEIAVWQKLTQGSDLTYLARMEEGQRVLDQALTLAKTVQPDLLGEVKLRLGTLAALQADLPRAQASYHEALEQAVERKNIFLRASALAGLGFVALRREHYDESVDWNNQALEMAKSADALGLVAKIEGNIAWGYKRVGDLENSLAANRNAEKDALRAGLQQDRVLSLLNAGSALMDMKDVPSAEADTRKALALAKELHDNPDAIYCYLNLAMMAAWTGRMTEAQQNVEEALRLEASAADQVQRLDIHLVAAHIAARAHRAQEAEKIYAAMIQSETPASVRWIVQSDLAQLHALRGETALAEKEFQQSIATISKAWQVIEQEELQLSFLTNVIEVYDAYVDFLIDQKRPLEALKIAEESRARTLEQGLSIQGNGGSRGPVSYRPEKMARRWKATLLFYWLGEKRSYLWVITPAKVSLLPLPGKREIDTDVKSYLDAFLDPRDPLEVGNAEGKNLYKTLVAPAEKLIPKNGRVVILPDGGLNSLNFETLIVPGEKPHYWIEDVTVLTANSLELLAKSSLAVPPGNATLFLMGDAVQANPDFAPLPQAGKEVALVQRYFPTERRKVLIGAEATPSGFTSGKPETFSYLHFTTHGTASTMRPLESAVILSPQGDSYKLYARDIVQHPLHAYLVTISACNGAGMRTYAGEGLIGLAWAFLRAGAHYVIGGLWEVSNASTPQLMDELYKGLSEGKDPASALREAKLTLVHSEGNYRRPFYWGPFQLYAGS